MNWRVDYDSIAPTFDKRYQRNPDSGVAQALRQFVGSDVGLRILEIGFGTGHWLEVLHTEGMHVTGLDPSSGMLAQAQARLPGVELVRGRAEYLPWLLVQSDHPRHKGKHGSSVFDVEARFRIV